MASRFSKRSLVILLLLFAPMIVGCQGCRDDQQLSAPTPAPALVARELQSIPSDDQVSRMLVKPGHWMSVTQNWQSNTDDLRGTLTFSPTIAASNISTLDSIRPAVLPKGQAKQLDCRVLIPMGLPGERKAIDIQTNFVAGTQAIPKDGGDRLAEAMTPHEYFFTVLSSRAEQLTVLQVSDWVRPPQTTFADERVIDFRIVFPSGTSRIPLPDTIFEWTSTAYVYWDDIAPEQLTIDQRRALRDWVYWGGQLLINGPASAEAIIASDLADLLPLDSVRGVGVESGLLIDLVNQCSVSSDKSSGTVTALLKDSSERVGVAGNLKPDAQMIPGTAELVVERTLGRGRVVMTRFDLTAGWMLKWDSIQSFYNGVLLRRPERVYEVANGEAILVNAGGLRGREHDPRLNTRFRFLTRDINLRVPAESAVGRSQVKPSENADSTTDKSDNTSDSSSPITPWLAPNDFYRPGQGIAAWNDNSDATLMSLELLREEAGITIPSVKFVAKSLAIYLLILVPLNYLVFWLLGRLEWAWVMVPVIGLVGAAWIARSAQLDIGFARSKTEIDILEMHAGYQRGHVTRYMALYNSLSTTYDIGFDTQDAVAAPHGIFANTNQELNCDFRQAFDPNVSLAGLAIPSNQTGTVHAEQMVDVGGSFEVNANGSLWDDEWELLNRTVLTLYDSVVVARHEDGTLLYSPIGIIEPASTNKIKLKPGAGKVAEDLPLSVNRLMLPLVDGRSLHPGQTLLVGRIEQAIEGVDISPTVSQSKSQTVVAVYLTPGTLPPAGIDRNLRKDVKTADFDDMLDQEQEPLN